MATSNKISCYFYLKKVSPSTSNGIVYFCTNAKPKFVLNVSVDVSILKRLKRVSIYISTLNQLVADNLLEDFYFEIFNLVVTYGYITKRNISI